VLLAAHGERRKDAGNEGVFRLARALARRGLAPEVAAGFVNGLPTIKDALDALTSNRVIVYPLFASSGYFTRDRLVQLIDEADNASRLIRILPPLGLDPGLPAFVTSIVKQTARERGFAADQCTAILLAHGSRRNSASREATGQIAREVERHAAFREVRTAFLEESPFVHDAVASVAGPAVVVGLFSGEGMHGASDAPRLTAGLGRDDIVFAGVIGSAPGIEDLVARSVGEALLQEIRRCNPLVDADAAGEAGFCAR
jgi:sirohydrochlorin ferrochelatase